MNIFDDSAKHYTYQNCFYKLRNAFRCLNGGTQALKKIKDIIHATGTDIRGILYVTLNTWGTVPVSEGNIGGHCKCNTQHQGRIVTVSKTDIWGYKICNTQHQGQSTGK